VSTLLLLLAGAVLGLGISFRLAPPTTPPSRHLVPWMSRLDADGSGAITRDEYVQISDGLISYDLLDRNSDGAIDTRELEVFLRTVDPMWTFSEPD
jgi:hypothetical protein